MGFGIGRGWDCPDGATIYGGGLGNCGSGCGTVYELSPAGNGTWTETILHRFIGGSGGSEPSSPLTIDGHGNLFGETALVGSNNGTIFRLSPKTTGGFAFKVLFTFDGTDGSYPQGGVYVAPGGTLFGTTIEGGSSNSGVAFSFRP